MPVVAMRSRDAAPEPMRSISTNGRRGGLFIMIGRSTFESPGLSASQAAVSNALQTPARYAA